LQASEQIGLMRADRVIVAAMSSRGSDRYTRESPHRRERIKD